MILCDIHTHSHHSFDAESSVEEMCRAAIKRGLTYLAVTDHCEAEYICCGEDCEFGSFDRQIPQSIAAIREAQQKYGEQLKLLCGLELGEPMHDPEQTKHALAYGDSLRCTTCAAGMISITWISSRSMWMRSCANTLTSLPRQRRFRISTAFRT